MNCCYYFYGYYYYYYYYYYSTWTVKILLANIDPQSG